MIYGYARVSTKEQREDRQLIALMGYGVKKRTSIPTSKAEKILSVANTSGCLKS